MFPNDVQVWLYRIAYKCRHLALAVFCVLTVINIALGGSAVYLLLVDGLSIVVIARAAMMVVFLLVLYVWTTVFAWYSPRFRYLAYSASRLWTATGWQALAFLTFGVAVFLGLAAFASQEERWGHWGLTLLMVLFGVLFVRLLLRSRKRVMVNAFSNYIQDSELAQATGGIATRLVNEFVQLAKLYADINRSASDEARGFIGKDQSEKDQSEKGAGITFGLEDEGTFLQDAVSTESKVSLFKVIDIPVGAIFGLIQRFVRGPRLTGSVHRDGKQMTLIANLRLQDQKFAACRHNLAVVYDCLGNKDGSKVELEQAVRLEPNNFAARRSLALRYWEDKHYYEAIAQCRAVLALRPQSA